MIDNGSDDGTPDRVESGDYGVTLVREPVNRGYASAVNRGL